MLLDLLVDIPELHAPIGVLGSFQRLGVGLQAETLLLEQTAHRRRGHRMPRPGQLLCQIPQRLHRPPQRRHRIPTLVRFHQGQQRLNQSRIQLLPPTYGHRRPAAHARPGNGCSPASSSKTPLRTVVFADPCRPGRHPNPAMPQRPGFAGQRQPPLPLVQMRQQHRQPPRQASPDPTHDRHSTPKHLAPQHNTLLRYSFTTR